MSAWQGVICQIAVRNSMGVVFKMPILPVACLAEALARLQRQFQTLIVTADPHGASTIHDVKLTGNVCIVLGNEDAGVSVEIAALANRHAAIPMRNRTDSLNVASASAVFLYEADRQRAKAQPKLNLNAKTQRL
ncbi:MAG: RNA methyltransferase [Acidobacteriota bacterium]|jgi:tRNA G18 (ribose-2'-O)-methylase SpoU